MTFVRVLNPGMSSQATFATPVGGGPWRLAVLWARAPILTPWQRIELVAQRVFRVSNRGLQPQLCTNFSAEVRPQSTNQL
jgi:hypothetical protein